MVAAVDTKTQTEWTAVELPRLERAPDQGRDVLSHALSLADPHGLWLEFGVAGGMSLTWIVWTASTLPGGPSGKPRIVGFDSFKGLPEAWVWNYAQQLPKGHFAQETIPVIPGAEIIVGLFQDSLKPWLKKLPKDQRRITFVHIDCDLYSSSRYVLASIAPYLTEGCVIAFDELVGYHGFDHHEWRALYETTEQDRAFDFEWLARNAQGQQVSIRVRKHGASA